MNNNKTINDKEFVDCPFCSGSGETEYGKEICHHCHGRGEIDVKEYSSNEQRNGSFLSSRGDDSKLTKTLMAFGL